MYDERTAEAGSAAISWLVTASLNAVFGLLAGSILLPVVTSLLALVRLRFPPVVQAPFSF